MPAADQVASGMISLSWHPLSDLIALLAFVKHHVLKIHNRYFGALSGFDSDNHVYWSAIRVQSRLGKCVAPECSRDQTRHQVEMTS